MKKSNTQPGKSKKQRPKTSNQKHSHSNLDDSDSARDLTRPDQQSQEIVARGQRNYSRDETALKSSGGLHPYAQKPERNYSKHQSTFQTQQEVNDDQKRPNFKRNQTQDQAHRKASNSELQDQLIYHGKDALKMQAFEDDSVMVDNVKVVNNKILEEQKAVINRDIELFRKTPSSISPLTG